MSTITARKVKYSSRFPHLSYELSYDARGQVVAHFKEGHAFRTYILAEGKAIRIDESDRYSWDYVTRSPVILPPSLHAFERSEADRLKA